MSNLFTGEVNTCNPKASKESATTNARDEEETALIAFVQDFSIYVTTTIKKVVDIFTIITIVAIVTFNIIILNIACRV